MFKYAGDFGVVILNITSTASYRTVGVRRTDMTMQLELDIHVKLGTDVE